MTPQPPKVELTDTSLRSHVNQRITIAGFWNSRGKLSGFIHGPDRSAEPIIYVKGLTTEGLAKENDFENGIKDDSPVQATGVLRWYASPPVPAGMNAEISQRSPDHFYFDAAEVEIRVIGR